MTRHPLHRISGQACIAGGLLTSLWFIVHPFDMGYPFGADGSSIVTRSWTLEMLAGLLGFSGIALGLPGLYARTADRTGLTGLLGYLLAMVGTLLFFGLWFTDAFYVPFFAQRMPELFAREALPLYQQGALLAAAPPAALTFLLGFILLPVALVRTRFLPASAAVLLVVGAVGISGAPALPHWAYSYLPLLHGAGMVWAGKRLLASDQKA